MLRVDVHIEVGNYLFDFANEIEVNQSWKDMTQTCVIKMPRKTLTKSGKKIQDVFKSGDKVLIKLGYDDNLQKRFEGYLNTVKATIPVQLHCEDEMWILKQKSVKPYSWKEASVDDVLKYLEIQNYTTFGDILLGPFQIDINIKSVVGVFNKIKKEYGINFFFRDKVLVVGKPYDSVSKKVHQFTIQKSIIENTLEYKSADDIKVKVRAISTLDSGQKIEVVVGDEDGEVHTLNYYNITSSANLREKATQELELLKYTGYRGTIKVFGEPHVKHGDVVKLLDTEYPERNGSFFVDRVTTTLSSGIRQNIELGKRAS